MSGVIIKQLLTYLLMYVYVHVYRAILIKSMVSVNFRFHHIFLIILLYLAHLLFIKVQNDVLDRNVFSHYRTYHSKHAMWHKNSDFTISQLYQFHTCVNFTC